MLAYLEELSAQDQEGIREILKKLYRQTFILERKYDRRAGRMVINKEYYFCEKHMEFLKEYLEVAGIQIFENSQLGTIYIQGEATIGERLPKLSTIYLLLLKLLYDEQMEEVSSSVNIVTTLGDLTGKAGEFGLIRSLISQAEMKRALNVLKRFQMIEVLDSMDELNNQTRIIIFPSINVVLMREDILKLLALFAAEDSEEENGEDTDAGGRDGAEERVNPVVIGNGEEQLSSEMITEGETEDGE